MNRLLKDTHPGASRKEIADLRRRIDRWIKRADGPDKIDEALDYANEILGGHGVESVQVEDYQVDRYYYNIILLYVNRGDAYAITLCYDTEEHEFFVGSWGDWYEEWDQKHQIEEQ